MFPTPQDRPFGITHPLGLPRPIDGENIFGARIQYFARNMMPIPTGCLAHFDGTVYRPYVQQLVAALNRLEFGWAGPAMMPDPPRYCLLQDGEPACIPADLRPMMPEPPRVSVAALLRHFDRNHQSASPMQLLDVLTLVGEDLGPVRFAEATAEHPWVAEFLR